MTILIFVKKNNKLSIVKRLRYNFIFQRLKGISIWFKAKKSSLFRSLIKDLLTPKIISLIKEQTNAPDMLLSLKKLKEKGFIPKHAIDVGSFIGEWSLKIKEIFPESNVIMIEPQESQKDFLVKLAKKNGFKYEQALLSNSDNEEINFNISDLTNGSSIFEPKRFIKKKVVKFKTKKLDTLISKYKISEPIILKIDTQGAEKLVLQGSLSLLKKCEVIILELSIFKSYSDGNNAYEMIDYLHQLGYDLYDIDGFNRNNSTKSINEFDALFVKKDSKLWHPNYFLPKHIGAT